MAAKTGFLRSKALGIKICSQPPKYSSLLTGLGTHLTESPKWVQISRFADGGQVIDIGKFTSQQHQSEELRIISNLGGLYRGNWRQWQRNLLFCQYRLGGYGLGGKIPASGIHWASRGALLSQ